ncbi:hypothetical protein SAY87_005457 [Trapa incisa]|uniref:Uncharacterized protein n=1 Tax=Trapa incisa TaxID=236973 RepID=A0AAN7Q7N2_9MYRT|nr:hypothetical protein SAY87_005457 [Trapa incisa]
MKRPVHPMFSILLLAAFAISLTVRDLVRRGLSPFDIQGCPRNLCPAPAFNSTILKLAEVDLGEHKLKNDTEQLLQWNFSDPSRHRAFEAWRRVNADRSSRTAVPAGSTLPFTIRSPRFYPYLLVFRRNLQAWARKKRFQDDIMSDLLRQVRHPIDRSERKYTSCAVVGNSGILLNTHYGNLIDSHEAVIRLNNAIISSYEDQVGTKTTISFVNSNILHFCSMRQDCFCHPYGPDIPILMYICQAIHLLDYTACNSTHKSPLLVTDPRFDTLCSRIAKYYSLKRFVATTGKPLEDWDEFHDGPNFHYSSGMQAVMLSMAICDQIMGTVSI